MIVHNYDIQFLKSIKYLSLKGKEMIGRSYGSQTLVGSVVKMVWEFHSDSSQAYNNELTYGLFFSTIKRNMLERFYKTRCSNTVDTGHPISEQRRIAEPILKVERPTATRINSR